MSQLKVKSKSEPKSVAGALTGMMRDGAEKVEIVTVGAGALNQAIKAIAIARGYLAPSGINIAIVPSFAEVTIGDAERTAINTTVVRL